jgi:hypothetical protein
MDCCFACFLLINQLRSNSSSFKREDNRQYSVHWLEDNLMISSHPLPSQILDSSFASILKPDPTFVFIETTSKPPIKDLNANKIPQASTTPQLNRTQL